MAFYFIPFFDRIPLKIYGICVFCICFLAPFKISKLICFVLGGGLIGTGVIFIFVFLSGGQYEPITGSYTDSFYAAPEKVMVIVPHEDDELNLAAGVIDSYRAEGVQVKVVFMSNGDALFNKPFRLEEALQSQKYLGAQDDDIIFLGYGDQYNSPYGHLYNAPNGELVASKAGHTRTYGLDTYPEFRKKVSGHSSLYIRENVVQDLQDVLSMEMPDVIFCIDQDPHPDHRATSLFFEEALSNLLRTDSNYHPEVYKGFGYSTAWSSPNIYYNSNNVPSTQPPFEWGRMEEVNCYLWDERLRIPVAPQNLGYTQLGSTMFPSFVAHASQDLVGLFGSIMRSDKVFWHRRTDSMLYTASFSAINQNGLSKLNDFKLADNEQVAYLEHRSYDGVWIPGEDDVLTVNMKSDQAVGEIVLYDNPSLEDNILDALITLEDGTELHTGPLEPGGAGTSLILENKVELSSFTVKILESEGEYAGLCEAEAYSGKYVSPEFIKLTDENNNFIYTYTLSKPSDETLLQLYTSGSRLKMLALDMENNFIAEADGEPLEVRDGAFILRNPDKKIKVRVSLISNRSIYDEIVIKPYSYFREVWLPIARLFDEMCCDFIMWLNSIFFRIRIN